MYCKILTPVTEIQRPSQQLLYHGVYVLHLWYRRRVQRPARAPYWPRARRRCARRCRESARRLYCDAVVLRTHIHTKK